MFATETIALRELIKSIKHQQTIKKMKQILTTLALTILVLTSVLAQHGGRAGSLIEKGKRFYKEKNYTVAKQYFDLALELEPENLMVLIQQALIACKGENDSTNAKKYIDLAIEVKPDHPYCHTISADINNHFKNYKKAIEDCNRALELNPSLKEAYGNRSIAYWYLGHKEQAYIDLDRVIELTGGTDAKAYHNKAIYNKDDRKYQEALQYFNKAIALDGSYSFAYYNRAKLFVMMNSAGKACQDFQVALDLGLSSGQQKMASKFIKQMNCLIADQSKL